MRHMRSVHPDFSLAGTGGAWESICWRGEPVGRLQPLDRLAPATTPDCFIVGTGPSINEIDFARLRGQACIGVNGSILKSEESAVPFRSHVITDRRFFMDRFELATKVVRSGGECLFSFRCLSVICERQPDLLQGARVFLLDEVRARYDQPKPAPEAFDEAARRDPDLVLHPRLGPSNGWVGFSRDIRKGVFTGQTVVFSALQVAVWLGYRRIFLLGTDFGGPVDGQRFYESGKDAAPMRLDRDYEAYIQPAFEVASTLLGELGVEIYNLSQASRLPTEIVPKLSFEAALEMARSPG
jgi:Kdo-III transferase WaaZ